MEIHEITQRKRNRKAKKLDEVNWGALPGALGGIAAQALQQKLNPNQELVGKPIPPGQEKNAAYAATDDLVKQQSASAYQTWQQAMQAKLQEFNVSDASKIGQHEIETTLKNYVEQRLMGGLQGIDSLQAQPIVTTNIKQAMQTIVQNSLANKWKDPKTAEAWARLIRGIRIAQSQDVRQLAAAGSGPGARGGNARGGGVTLNSQTQALSQRIAPYTTSIARLLPSNYNSTQISPTSNSSVNAILANLGLLKGYKPGTP